MHFLPLLFLVSLFALILSLFVDKLLLLIGASVLVVYYWLLFIDSTIKNGSLMVGFLSIITATVQLCAYAIGMVTEFLKSKPNRVDKY